MVKIKGLIGTMAALASVAIFSANDAQAYTQMEQEKNDTFQSAQFINVNTAIQGEISKDDPIDYYKVNVEENGRLDVALPNISGVRWSMEVFNEDGQSIDYKRTDSSSTALGDTTISVGVAPGMYYVAINNYNNATRVPYTADISLRATNFYEKELNNSFVTATPIQLNSENFGMINYNDLLDYYKFTTTEPGLATITMPNVHDMRWELEVLSEDGKVMDSFRTDSSSTALDESVIKLGLPVGTYYIKVINYNNASGKEYSFVLDYTVGDNFEQEYNNSIQTANFISLNKDYFGTVSQKEYEDFYAFQLDKDSKTTIKVKNELYKRWDITLFDVNGKQIDYIRTVDGSTTNAYAELTNLLPAGKYYVRIVNYNNASGHQYQFSINTPQNIAFKDVSKSHPYYNEINEVRNMGIITGYDDGTFKPNNTVTRQHIAAMIIRSGVKLESIRYSTTFSDVNTNHTYYDEIMTLYRAGIIDGSVKNNNRYFSPKSNITRAQLSKILVNAYKLTGNGSGSYFSDVKSSEWYASYANILAANGVILDNTKKFKASAFVTRAELAYMIKKAKDASK